MTQEELIQLGEDCRRVALIVSRDYRAVEADDLAQELFLQAWKAHGQIDNMEPWLFKAARGIAVDMHEQVMKCQGWSQYEYTSNMVRKVLEYSFVYGNWEHIPLPDSARSAPRTARAMWDQEAQADVHQSVPDPTDARDVAADVQRALDLIPEADRIRLIRRYKFGERPAPGAESSAFYRSLRKLTAKLNSYRGLREDNRMSGRRAMRNSQAQAVISGQT